MYSSVRKEEEFRRRYEEIFALGSRLVRENCAQFESYASLVESGDFYERVFFRSEGRMFNGDTERNDFKETVFAQILYGEPFYDSKVVRAFKEMFPAIHELICLMKSVRFEVFPKLMQRIESEVIIESAAKDFLDRSGGSFLATVHDSFFCAESDAWLAKVCLQDAFARFGLTPECRLKTKW